MKTAILPGREKALLCIHVQDGVCTIDGLGDIDFVDAEIVAQKLVLVAAQLRNAIRKAKRETITH